MAQNSPSNTAKRRTRKLIQQIPSIRSLSRKNCPAGMIRKKAYVRKYSTAVKERGYTVKKKNGKEYRILPKASEMYVESKCVKNTGLPGKGPALFGPLRRGELAKHGYSFRKSDSVRHAALKRAIEEYGALGVYRKLDVVVKLFKRTHPTYSERFKADREWVHRQLSK
jgi:hypothetical protein